jgi:uncharacterized coiled-coil protein SlyX
MTKEEALALLQSASRTDKPCSINRNLTESQAVGIIEACVVKVADGGTLHNILEKRVRQMLIPINAKDAKIAELQSTITAQEETIKRYQALMNKHIVGKCPQCNYMASWPVCTKCGTPYPDGMNELGEK